MYGLLWALAEPWRTGQRHSYRILVLGIDESGKTTWVRAVQSVHHERQMPDATAAPPPPPTLPDPHPHSLSSAYQPTVGLSVTRLSVRCTDPASATRHTQSWLLWDLGGKAALRGIWERYLPEADAIVWVMRTSEPSDELGQLSPRWSEACAELQRVLHRLPRRHDADRSVPLLVVLNGSADERLLSQLRSILSAHAVPRDRNAPTERDGTDGRHATSHRHLLCSGVQRVDLRSGAGVAACIDWLALQFQASGGAA